MVNFHTLPYVRTPKEDSVFLGVLRPRSKRQLDRPCGHSLEPLLGPLTASNCLFNVTNPKKLTEEM